MGGYVKKSDLYREYARVIDMCEGTGLEQFDCMKYMGRIYRDHNGSRNPSFDRPASEFSFALAIVEGKPVFEGDVLYCTAEHCWICRQNGTSKFIVGDKSTGGVGPNFDKATWTPPKPKTITVTIPYDAAKEFSVQTFWNNQFIDIQNAIKEAIK